MTNFDGVLPALAQALNARGYADLTPVQTAMLAPELAKSDALVSAQTGSGKTVAFGLAIAPTLLEGAARFSKADRPLALIIAPTRELALQVKREFEWLYKDTGATIASCVGGMDSRTERRALERGVHIVMGTPGRLRDHIMRKALDTSELRAVVLDEADEMLDLGFREDLEFILETTPKDRRTLMFSATVPPTIAKLAQQYQRDAVRVATAGEKQQHVDIDYQALVVASRERENAIINVLRYYEAKNALVFCNTRASVNHMVARFKNRGFSVVALSGELTQSERTHALQAMRDGRARVCIATDVAARGIDLPNLELVVHAELPSNPEILLHRSGRTGRAGRKGVSTIVVDQKGRNRAERLLRFAKINATWAAPPSADDVIRRDEERLLADPLLTDPVLDDEQGMVARLLADHPAEQIAAAFLRLASAGKSAPEDVQQLSIDAPQKREFNEHSERRPKKQHEEFAKSVWVSLSVGRKQNAEPRWLIPLICNAGEITKRDIGMIKMQPDETFVQINAEQSDVFFDALGPNLTLEKNVRVKRLDGVPKFNSKSYGKPNRGGSPRGPKKWKGKPKRDSEGKNPVWKKHNSDNSAAGPGGGKTDGPAPASKARKSNKPVDGGKPATKKEGWAKKKSKAGKPNKKLRHQSKNKNAPTTTRPKKKKKKPRS